MYTGNHAVACPLLHCDSHRWASAHSCTHTRMSKHTPHNHTQRPHALSPLICNLVLPKICFKEEHFFTHFFFVSDLFLLFYIVEPVCQQGECCPLLNVSEGGGVRRQENLAACLTILQTPQLQPGSILPLVTVKIAEVGLGPHPPWYLGVRWQRGTLRSQVWGKGRSP